MIQPTLGSHVNCACVIHGDLYSWQYVDHLFNMLQRHLSSDIKLHVFTEKNRPVPNHMVKHNLQEWPGISGRKKAWWYKMQMFDPENLPGQNLYFDLDTIIINDLSWITDLDTEYFWTIRDFRHLWRPHWQGINSSMMYWHSDKFSWIWQDFAAQNIHAIAQQHRGDQDYLNAVLDKQQIRFIDQSYVKSWRWQIFDGGLDASMQQYHRPGAGAVVPSNTKFVVFHGNPKPHDVQDPFVLQHWR